jgi:EKC/KEOPS complex subunit CGI121/TPRKB
MTDWAKVKKIYKLNSVPTGSGSGKKATNGVVEHPSGEELKELEVMILGSMALRGAAS